ncbi:hypothetical protein GCM10011289_04770 [Paludibacterium paludis]|uniref:Uncharacterized protein n=1 Tax=Paludibacterium paludis TaxID=1225769 RepID=A0A918U7E6_9NEIS|nr:hypothetical protein GCM10011289_04770 [Paludibacterium paludis]
MPARLTGALPCPGIKRISMGKGLFDHLYRQMAVTLAGIAAQHSFEAVFANSGR